MTEIRVEKKESKGWLWGLLALLAVALLAWWLFGRNDVPATASAADSAGVPTAVTPDLGADRGAVDGFLAWAANTDTVSADAAGNLSHDYTATGVRQLAGAIGSIARGDSLAGAGLDAQVSALNTLADRLQTEPQSLKHADLAHAAFASAAQLLREVQQRFPNASAQVASVQQAADAVSKDRPLLEQRAEINRFFTSAADAVRAMSGGA